MKQNVQAQSLFDYVGSLPHVAGVLLLQRFCAVCYSNCLISNFKVHLFNKVIRLLWLKWLFLLLLLCIVKFICCKIASHSVNVPEEFNFRGCLLTRVVWDFFTCGNYHRSLISLVIWCVLKLWLKCVFMTCIFRAVNECYFQWFHTQHVTNLGMGEYNPIPRRLLWTKQPSTWGFP